MSLYILHDVMDLTKELSHNSLIWPSSVVYGQEVVHVDLRVLLDAVWNEIKCIVIGLFVYHVIDAFRVIKFFYNTT